MGLRRQTYNIITSSNLSPEDILELVGIGSVQLVDGHYDAIRGWQISFVAQHLVGTIDCDENEKTVHLYY